MPGKTSKRSMMQCGLALLLPDLQKIAANEPFFSNITEQQCTSGVASTSETMEQSTSSVHGIDTVELEAGISQIENSCLAETLVLNSTVNQKDDLMQIDNAGICTPEESSSNLILTATEAKCLPENCTSDDYDLQGTMPVEPLEIRADSQMVLCYSVGFQQFTENAEFNNFLKGCKWSPDGSCLLTNSEDKTTRVFELSDNFISCGDENMRTSVGDSMNCISKVVHGELVYDYCWYPLLRKSLPDSCVYLTTSRDHPVHMWDSCTGVTRCTYRAMNHLDELTSSHSVAFSPDGQRIVCGYNKTIRIFNTERPGRQCDVKPTVVKGLYGQFGIISCFAFAPDQTGHGVFAAGSYGRSIALYADNVAEIQCIFHGQTGGVTHMTFSKCGYYLFSGGRMDPEILCWDMRMPGKVLYTAERPLSTNQRIYFDIERSGRFLASGSTNGSILKWNINTNLCDNVDNSEKKLEPLIQFKAHSSCVNGVSFHPYLNVLASSSGQRVFADVDDYASSEEEGSANDQAKSRYMNAVGRKESITDNTLKLWLIK